MAFWTWNEWWHYSAQYAKTAGIATSFAVIVSNLNFWGFLTFWVQRNQIEEDKIFFTSCSSNILYPVTSTPSKSREATNERQNFSLAHSEVGWTTGSNLLTLWVTRRETSKQNNVSAAWVVQVIQLGLTTIFQAASTSWTSCRHHWQWFTPQEVVIICSIDKGFTPQEIRYHFAALTTISSSRSYHFAALAKIHSSRSCYPFAAMTTIQSSKSCHHFPAITKTKSPRSCYKFL